MFKQSDSLQNGLSTYFNEKIKLEVMNSEEANKIMNKTFENINNWLQDNSISQLTKDGIIQAIEQEQWSDLVYAFWQEVTFGTGGIRGRAALTEEDLKSLALNGLSAKILKGPNTINDVVFSKITNGVARYMKKREMKNVVIGYDSRIRGRDFAELIARIFISKGIKVHLFDEPTPYPELSYAVTFLRADIGIEVSASHNDKRYNGYKICTVTGASLNLKQRAEIIDEIYGNENNKEEASTELSDLKDASPDSLAYLGGDKPLLDIGNHSYTNLHKEYLGHIKDFVLRLDTVKENMSNVNIGYCAYYGSGHKVVPWLLKEMGFNNLKIVSEMNTPNGLFPAFKLTELPDPGFIGSAEKASAEFKKEHGDQAFEALDMFVGTDPDADRMGLTINVPKTKRSAVSGDWRLLTANDLWTLVLWYRLSTVAEKNGGKIPDTIHKSIIKSHVTSEALRRVAKKFNIECRGTWVGFGFLAEEIIEEWGRGRANLGAFEESNGFTIGGAKPQKEETLGQGGHTLEKDGTLATLLTAEIAAFAKSKKTTLMDMLNSLYLDPEIGCFVTIEITLPEIGVFEGVEGELLKRKIIRNVERMAQKITKGDNIAIAGLPIVKTETFATGKYDNIYWTGFPDEGLRFYFDNTGDYHLTIRPSGTEAKLRFYVQHKLQGLTQENVWDDKALADKFVEKLARAAIDMVQTKQF
ncbi:MAG: hypothetical protein LBE70_01685 [Nitrososphaerota archaeon]|jgi:phosphoglucomutase|nr:hypothetical protein [Nitrososphaerota archaeon]